MFFCTQKGNSYYHDSREGYSLLLHPNLLKILTDGYDKENISNNYYALKADWLRKYGYFTTNNTRAYLNRELMAENVKRFFVSSSHLCFEVTEKCN